MDKVIPRAINYSDIKPEAIENMVRVVKFTPTATVNSAKANDIVRFMLLGNGFYDPYSAYIKIEVTTEFASMKPAFGNYCGRFLDRSAHSIINRLVVKSQGTEIERVEQYDVVAAMINDMLYSQEQSVFHHFEGMPTSQADLGGAIFAGPVKTPLLYKGTNTLLANNLGGLAALPFLQNNCQDLCMRFIGDQGFWKIKADAIAHSGEEVKTFTRPQYDINGVKTNAHEGTADMVAREAIGLPGALVNNFKFVKRNIAPAKHLSITDAGGSVGLFGVDLLAKDAELTSASVMTYCIPIYSGVIGVLMPDKKMLPLSLIPLEVEFTMNPHAYYGAGQLEMDTNPRYYEVRTFHIYTHMLFFEQELHRSLESVVAENGIFIHFNSFYLAPVTQHSTSAVQSYAQINIHAKSINSVHFVFLYNGFEASNGPRKLHFVNHNITSIQIRNGTELTPSEPITGDQGADKTNGSHSQYLLETLKAWNKMHDPTLDCAITGFSYSVDYRINQWESIDYMNLLFQQAQLGRCQYAISMEGEELGQDKTIITGRKGLIPFDINFGSSTKAHDTPSWQLTFVRADYILYVRPDLVVTVLGR